MRDPGNPAGEKVYLPEDALGLHEQHLAEPGAATAAAEGASAVSDEPCNNVV